MRNGGERSWSWAAESFSMTTMGPPHWGQSQTGRGSLTADAGCSTCGCGTAPVGEEAEVTDADEALGQCVQQEAAQELIERQSHQLVFVASVVARGAPLEKLFTLGYKPKPGHLVDSERLTCGLNGGTLLR
jgi:hypothetical protein